MISSKRKLSVQSLIIAFLVLACLVTAGAYTYAWFTDSKEGTGTVTFGKIEMGVTSNSVGITTATFDKANLMPGDQFLNYDVMLAKTATSQSFYFRITLEFTTLETGIDAFVTALNNQLVVGNIGTGSNFVKDADETTTNVFYYGTATTTMTPVSTTTPIKVLDVTKLVVPTTLEQLDAQAQYNKNITLTVTVEAIQVSNISATLAAVKSALTVE